ncbi:MAG: rhodanese-like domain-containing protein [Wenzhouxiangella sp.]
MHASARKSWGVVALLSATVALTTACGQGSQSLEGDIERVGSAIARGEAQISIPDLSHKVIEDHGDFVLIDLREAADFEAFHIPGAVNVSAMEIVRPEKAREVAGGRQIILYGDSTVAASQASAVLQVAGFNALALAAGFDDWFAYTSDPNSQVASVDASVSASDRQAFAEFFHGGAADAAAGYSPAVSPAGGGASAALGLAPAGGGASAALGLAPADSGGAATTASVSDPHGLGLHLGIGVDIERPELAVAEEEETPQEAPRRLIIGEGC